MRWYILGLCLVASARIFFGSAALPLFNDVDEQAHFDLVHKLARGYWPVRPHEAWDRETAEIQVLYGTYEFLNKPENYRGGVYPPPVWSWEASPERQDYVKRRVISLVKRDNHEVHSPPVYYLLGAAFHRLGRLAGLSGPNAVYLIRFLNVIFFACLIATAYAFCRRYFSPFVALSVPALAAFFPSTVFFGIASDALLPLAGALALWLLLAWHARETPATWLSTLAGVVAAAAFLVKLTNFMIPVLCVTVVAARLRRSLRDGTFRRDWQQGLLLLLALSLPIGCWMSQNELFLGDPLGTAAKVQAHGWHVKPLRAIFDHPFFTLAGQRTFWGDLFVSFYVGDMSWHGAPAMRLPLSDRFFLASFLLPPLAGSLAWLRRRQLARSPFHVAGGLCVLMIVGSVAFLVVQSLMWDFGDKFFFSTYPYLNRGRFLGGALVPFLALYAASVEVIVPRSRMARAAIIAGSVALMVAPQVALLSRTYRSRYNWFHLAAQGSAADGHVGRGILALKRQRIDEAAEHFSRASDADPSDISALANLGAALTDLGEYERAEQAYTRALRVQPGSAVLRNDRGAVRALRGRWAEAADDLGAAAASSPEVPSIRFAHGQALSKAGRAAEADEEYAAALRLAPRWPEQLARTAWQMCTLPDPVARLRFAPRAVLLAEQANAALGESHAEVLGVLACAYAEAGHLAEAVTTAEQALRVASEGDQTDLAAKLRERGDDYRARLRSASRRGPQ